MLEKIEVELATAGPNKAGRQGQRANLIRGLLAAADDDATPMTVD